MNDQSNDILNQLIEKGVRIPCPESIEIGPEVNPARIAGQKVTIHTGCKIFGANTLVLSGVTLGYEAPVTIHNCQLGKGVRLGGGFFSESCFLHGAAMGSGAQIREACLLEEGANGAHCVGLKHTILLPFVTLGSLINFCDCLMAGGTDEKNHSEVGSAYIHFNYTPNQDKATASLIGDVPKGVMINQKPIFLGGQGGLVGPVKINYGNVIAAGSIIRKDIHKTDRLFLGQAATAMSLPFSPGRYANIRRIVSRNTDYIANLIALRRWHLDIRPLMMGGNDPMEKSLLTGAVEKLDMAVAERIKRLGQVAENTAGLRDIPAEKAGSPAQTASHGRRNEFSENWTKVADVFFRGLDSTGDRKKRDSFLQILDQSIRRNGHDYLQTIKGLTREEAELGTAWLQSIVDEVCNQVLDKLPRLGLMHKS